MTTPLEFISEHPKLASVVCLVNMVGAYHVSELTMPLILMQVFQIMAWSVTITVGSITIYGSVNKWLKKQFKKH